MFGLCSNLLLRRGSIVLLLVLVLVRVVERRLMYLFVRAVDGRWIRGGAVEFEDGEERELAGGMP